jgi:hypothetical protein
VSELPSCNERACADEVLKSRRRNAEALKPWLDGAPSPSQSRIAHNLDLRRLYGLFVHSQRHACRLGRVRLFSDLMLAILFVLADCGGGQPAGAARLLLDAAVVASAGGLERDQQAAQARSIPKIV